jgi:hypothetical protein
MKWRFAGIFLVSFALLLVVWSLVDCAQRYRSAVLATVQVVSPVVNGWWLDYDRPGLVNDVAFRSGDQQLPMLVQLPALSMGIVPLLSLVLATPGLGLRGKVTRALIGAILYFLLDVVVVLAYPLIMERPNIIKDTAGVFSGLMAFVVAPLGLWFILTYRTLEPLWRLSPRPPRR